MQIAQSKLWQNQLMCSSRYREVGLTMPSMMLLCMVFAMVNTVHWISTCMNPKPWFGVRPCLLPIQVHCNGWRFVEIVSARQLNLCVFDFIGERDTLAHEHCNCIDRVPPYTERIYDDEYVACVCTHRQTRILVHQKPDPTIIYEPLHSWFLIICIV